MTEDHKESSRRIGIILPESVYEEGKEAAKRERRSFSNYVASLIDRATKPVSSPAEMATNGEPHVHP